MMYTYCIIVMNGGDQSSCQCHHLSAVWCKGVAGVVCFNGMCCPFALRCYIIYRTSSCSPKEHTRKYFQWHLPRLLVKVTVHQGDFATAYCIRQHCSVSHTILYRRERVKSQIVCISLYDWWTGSRLSKLVMVIEILRNSLVFGKPH